ncbi:hypothetical protein CBL_09118 [Carabus blaptoides fortunei]
MTNDESCASREYYLAKRVVHKQFRVFRKCEIVKFAYYIKSLQCKYLYIAANEILSTNKNAYKQSCLSTDNSYI